MTDEQTRMRDRISFLNAKTVRLQDEYSRKLVKLQAERSQLEIKLRVVDSLE